MVEAGVTQKKMSETIEKQIVLQRVRNRIIEVLELFSDENEFEIAVNNLEFWEDWVTPKAVEGFDTPIFTKEELKEITKVGVAWEKVELSSPRNSKEWTELFQSSITALKVFGQRGKLSESEVNA